ncbi:hypothetical protein [Gordonia tangerina]|uniref:Uncharacterized protein n=1 Tax=Gordonia tangerina TaxID=2911060 RepID=A0ABS9DN98_9ACTN|nr:hypothetical protein [Gordonia tangerina]MCF3940675.1 hypothetical protein [Gordonia tangerina]
MPEEPSLLASLGIDVDALPPPPAGVWDHAVQAAFDPSAAADPDTVPDMDDSPTPDDDDMIITADDDAGDTDVDTAEDQPGDEPPDFTSVAAEDNDVDPGTHTDHHDEAAALSHDVDGSDDEGQYDL